MSEKMKKTGEKLAPLVESRRRTAAESDFALNAAYWLLEANGFDPLLNLRDDYWCQTLLNVGPQRLRDLAGVLLRSHDVYADERDSWGPPKWQYSPNDPFDSFDFYMRHGCPNCGAKFNTQTSIDIKAATNFATLICTSCGHRPCPVHYDTESEAWVDRMSGAAASSPKNEKGCVYLSGTRRLHDFGQNGKEWWQSYYLPRNFRISQAESSMAANDLMGDSKGEIVKEVCEVCGHDEAFFATFQARSADEGLTILYECTRCQSRKTFNN